MIDAFEQQSIVSSDVGLCVVFRRARRPAKGGRCRCGVNSVPGGADHRRDLEPPRLRPGGTRRRCRAGCLPSLVRRRRRLDRIRLRRAGVWASTAIRSRPDRDRQLERAGRWCLRFEERALRSAIHGPLAVSARSRLLLAAQGDLDAAPRRAGSLLGTRPAPRFPSNGRGRCLVQGGSSAAEAKAPGASGARRGARRLRATRLGRLVEPCGRGASACRGQEGTGPGARPDRAPHQLAAAGLSNPEIAAAVFVSRKTVEANLARVTGSRAARPVRSSACELDPRPTRFRRDLRFRRAPARHTVAAMKPISRSFVVECFWPDVDEGELRELDERIRMPVTDGDDLRYLGSFLIRTDDVVLCQSRARSRRYVPSRSAQVFPSSGASRRPSRSEKGASTMHRPLPVAVMAACFLAPSATAKPASGRNPCALVSAKQVAAFGIHGTCKSTTHSVPGFHCQYRHWNLTSRTTHLSVAVNSYSSKSGPYWQVAMTTLNKLPGDVTKVSGIGNLAYESGGDGRRSPRSTSSSGIAS